MWIKASGTNWVDIENRDIFVAVDHAAAKADMAVTVATGMGDIVAAGDMIFVGWNLKPNPAEQWRHRVPARFVNSREGWKSVEEIDKRADHVPPRRGEAANARPRVFPHEGMPLRDRRRTIPSFRFYFGDMPDMMADKTAPAMPRDEVESHPASLVNPGNMAEY